MTRSIKHIALIATNYPSPAHPARGTFVEQLVKAIARLGTRCDVIHPLPVHKVMAERTAAKQGTPHDYGTLPVSVVRPKYASFSSKRFGPINTSLATQFAFERAAFRAVRRLPGTPDAIYGHFIHPAGMAAVKLGRRLGLPSFVAVGESSAWGVKSIGWARTRKVFRHITGVVAVSEVNRRHMISDIGVPAERTAVFPNGADLGAFYPRDKKEMRRKHQLPQDKFIVIFLGHFDERKGVRRVEEAVEGLDGVGVVYVGQGSLAPRGSQVLFKDIVPHDTIPEMLCAADLFVLPTLREGSCNAIVEAMACGLPVVTSVGEFNDDLVDDTMSLRVDPRNVGAIREAIVRLRDDVQLRAEMATAAADRGRQFDINRRAERICSWIAERIGQ